MDTTLDLMQVKSLLVKTLPPTCMHCHIETTLDAMYDLIQAKKHAHQNVTTHVSYCMSEVIKNFLVEPSAH